jgi:hypothetical protein
MNCINAGWSVGCKIFRVLLGAEEVSGVDLQTNGRAWLRWFGAWVGSLRSDRGNCAENCSARCLMR